MLAKLILGQALGEREAECKALRLRVQRFEATVVEMHHQMTILEEQNKLLSEEGQRAQNEAIQLAPLVRLVADAGNSGAIDALPEPHRSAFQAAYLSLHRAERSAVAE